MNEEDIVDPIFITYAALWSFGFTGPTLSGAGFFFSGSLTLSLITIISLARTIPPLRHGRCRIFTARLRATEALDPGIGTSSPGGGKFFCGCFTPHYDLGLSVGGRATGRGRKSRGDARNMVVLIAMVQRGKWLRETGRLVVLDVLVATHALQFEPMVNNLELVDTCFEAGQLLLQLLARHGGGRFCARRGRGIGIGRMEDL